MPVQIRRACDTDAGIAVDVLRSSIAQLCREDHHDHSGELSSWLGNKTVESWAFWLESPDMTLMVAEQGSTVCGVGLVRRDGEILLNYVSPASRFCGISAGLLHAMERDAREHGARCTRLESTRTAQRFYLSRGYTAESVSNPLWMSKAITLEA